MRVLFFLLCSFDVYATDTAKGCLLLKMISQKVCKLLFFHQKTSYFYIFFIKKGTYLKKMSYFCTYFRCFNNKHERISREND